MIITDMTSTSLRMTSITKTITIGDNDMIIIDTIDKTESFYQSKLDLNATEKMEVSLLSDKKKMEWYAVRYAIYSHAIVGKFTIGHDRNGKPYFKNNIKNELSISHSGNKVAVYIADKDCGIDIQFYSDKIIAVKDKFINNSESEFLKTDSYKKLHVIWSAKESIYKLISKKGISLKNDIMINPFDISGDNFNITGKYFKDEKEVLVNLGVELLENEILVWTIAG